MSYQYRTPTITKTNKIILSVAGACFLISSILTAIGAFDLVSLIGLTTARLTDGFLWQLVTYPFAERSLMSFLFNGLLIWYVGSELEGLWGTRIYLRFLLVGVLGVAVLFTAINFAFFYGTMAFGSPLYGLSGVNFALLIAYAMLYPERQLSLMMIFPMSARAFCWVLIGIEVYFAVISGLITSWAHLLAMGISYLLIKFQTRPLIRMVLKSSFQPKKQSRNHLYVVKDEDQKPPKFWQ